MQWFSNSKGVVSTLFAAAVAVGGITWAISESVRVNPLRVSFEEKTSELVDTQNLLKETRKELQDARNLYDALSRPCTKDVEQLRSQCSEVRQNNESITKSNQELSNSIAEWKHSHEQILNQRNVCWGNNEVLRSIADLDSRKAQSDRNISQLLSSVNCEPPCDLSSIWQRRLKAMEQERDQFNVRILDLQSRLKCLP